MIKGLHQRKLAWIRALCTTLTLASPGAAQQVVVPNGFDRIEAPGSAFWALAPFAQHNLLLIGPRQLGNVTSPIKTIQVRRNGTDQSPTIAGTLQIEIWMSHARKPPHKIKRKFAQNRGKKPTLVFKSLVNLPAESAPEQAPAAFSVGFQLLAPFAYRGGTLCIETYTTPASLPATAPRWPLDALVDTSGRGVVSTFGSNCVPGIPGDPAGAEPNSLRLGGTMALFVNIPTTATSTLCVIGSSNTLNGGTPLPLALAPFGAPGCSLNCSIDKLTPCSIEQLMPGRALAVFRASLPVQPSLAGAQLFSQWVVTIPGVNPLGIAFSNGVQATLGAVEPNRDFAWMESPDITASVGSVVRGRIPVLRLRL